jgi:excisionase family DNA binding protein
MDRIYRIPESKLLSTGQAAKLLSVTPNTVLKWIKGGRLPAIRTAGGHYRIASEDLDDMVQDQSGVPNHQPSRAFVFCWEYHAREGKICGDCVTCLVYRSRALRCFELSSLGRDQGFKGTFCQQSSCEDCAYYQEFNEQPPRVLVVTDSVRMRKRLLAESHDSLLAMVFASCEYECSAVVHRFRPGFVVIDWALSEEICSSLCSNLLSDARIPGVQIILAAPDIGIVRQRLGMGIAGEIPRSFSLLQLEDYVMSLSQEVPQRLASN